MYSVRRSGQDGEKSEQEKKLFAKPTHKNGAKIDLDAAVFAVTFRRQSQNLYAPESLLNSECVDGW